MVLADPSIRTAGPSTGPINGPAIAANGRDVAVAWFTASTGEGRALVAFSHDSGRSFSEPIRVDDVGSPGHVDVELLRDGAAAVSYTEVTGGQPQFRVRRVEASGARSPGVTVADVAVRDYPRLAHGRDELLFAWTDTEDGVSYVRTARAALLPAASR